VRTPHRRRYGNHAVTWQARRPRRPIRASLDALRWLSAVPPGLQDAAYWSRAQPRSGRDRLRDALERAGRLLRRRRRLLAAACLVVAVGGIVQSLTPRPPATVDVVVAQRDLPAGATIRDADVRLAAFPTNLQPAGTLHRLVEVTGRRLISPVRRGEPLTDVRFGGGAHPAPGLVAVPIHVADGAVTKLFSPGMSVDVLAADPDAPLGTPAVVVATDVDVLAVPSNGSDPAGDGSALLFVAASAWQARLLAQAQARSPLVLAVHDSTQIPQNDAPS